MIIMIIWSMYREIIARLTYLPLVVAAMTGESDRAESVERTGGD